jgi:hypothetical protein
MTSTGGGHSDPIGQRLFELVHRFPNLKEAAGRYEIILPLLRDADLSGGPVAIPAEPARAKMAGGLPLLHDLELELDRGAILDLMVRLISALAEVSGGNRVLYDRIKRALKNHRLDIGTLLSPVAADIRQAVQSEAHRLDLDPDLLLVLIQNAPKPALRAWCRQLSPLVDGIPWPNGFCFICGAKAILGELQDNHLVKHLRCGQCGADWQFSRLACPHCGNDDHHTLRYLYAEPDLEKMRVEVCDKCKNYLKVIVSFDPTSSEMLALEELETLVLDYIAQDQGYGCSIAGGRGPIAG